MKKAWIYLSLAVSALMVAVACGKKDDGGGSSGNTTAVTPTSCAAGQLYDSRYGCLQRGTCGSNMALYNNQCIVVQVTNVNQINQQNCPAGSMFSSYRNACLNQGHCGYGYVLYNNTCEYAGNNNNNVNYNNNYYNGYQYQNGYFYPQYPNYNNYYYGNGYNPYYQNGWGFRGGIWFRYY